MDQERQIRWDTEADRRSLGDIVGSVIDSLQSIFRYELRLARQEMSEKLRKSTKAGVFLGGAAVMGLFSGACLVATCVAALSIVLPVWLSLLVIGVALGAAAGGAFILGRLALEDVDPVPQQTVETMKDNIDWIRNRTR